MSYASTVLADNPTAYYRFNESSGTSAADSSGNGNAGTINTSGITYSVAGALTNDPNKAFTFDGSTGYVDAPSGLSPTGLTSFTVECWVKTAGFSGDARFLANGHTDSDNNGFQFFWSAGPALVRLDVGNGTVHATAFSSTGISTNTWYHVAAVYDGANCYVYLNGVAGTAAAFTAAVTSDAHAISIGRNPVYNGDYAAATFDEVAIYKGSALSSTRIQAHYNARTAFPNTTTMVRAQHRAVGRIQ